jgi:GT2 family glycosyltransferase
MILKKVAVLITCHNRRNKTIACLISLFDCSLPVSFTFDVFLVDDGSTDGTADAIKSKFPVVNIIHGDGNLFWNRGMRLAWATASGRDDYDSYLWLNDDTFLVKDALNIILSANEKTFGNSILVGSTISIKNQLLTYGGFVFPDTLIQPNGELQKCDFFNGNFVLVPFKVFNILGNLDGIFYHNLGDIDYGLRASKNTISSFIVADFVGYCEPHLSNPICFNVSYNLFTRLKHLYTPLGNNPLIFFAFDRKNFNILKAITHFFTIHLRVLFPFLWNKK